MASQSNRWHFSREQLQNTPSRKCGVEPEKELSYRQQAANLIQDMGQRLMVNQLCINTSIVYMHRFYMFHSFTKFPRNSIAAACLFLAAKVEEQPHKLEHVIKVAHLCLHRGTPLDTKSDTYLQQTQELVINESVILQTLGFEVGVDHPHTHVVKCTQMIRAGKDLAQTSYFMATNSLHLTTFCLQYKPTIVACVCIHLACRWAQWEIPKSNDGNYWWEYVDPNVTRDLLDTLTKEFLQIIEACPNRLKRRIMSHKQQPEKRAKAEDGSEYHSLEIPKLASGLDDHKLTDSPFDSKDQQKNMTQIDSPWFSSSKSSADGTSTSSIPGPPGVNKGEQQPAKKSLQEYRIQKEKERKHQEQKAQEEKIKIDHQKRAAYEAAKRKEEARRKEKEKIAEHRHKVTPTHERGKVPPGHHPHPGHHTSSGHHSSSHPHSSGHHPPGHHSSSSHHVKPVMDKHKGAPHPHKMVPHVKDPNRRPDSSSRSIPTHHSGKETQSGPQAHHTSSSQGSASHGSHGRPSSHGLPGQSNPSRVDAAHGSSSHVRSSHTHDGKEHRHPQMQKSAKVEKLPVKISSEQKHPAPNRTLPPSEQKVKPPKPPQVSKPSLPPAPVPPQVPEVPMPSMLLKDPTLPDGMLDFNDDMEIDDQSELRDAIIRDLMYEGGMTNSPKPIPVLMRRNTSGVEEDEEEDQLLAATKILTVGTKNKSETDGSLSKTDQSKSHKVHSSLSSKPIKSSPSSNKKNDKNTLKTPIDAQLKPSSNIIKSSPKKSKELNAEMLPPKVKTEQVTPQKVKPELVNNPISADKTKHEHILVKTKVERSKAQLESHSSKGKSKYLTKPERDRTEVKTQPDNVLIRNENTVAHKSVHTKVDVNIIKTEKVSTIKRDPEKLKIKIAALPQEQAFKQELQVETEMSKNHSGSELTTETKSGKDEKGSKEMQGKSPRVKISTPTKKTKSPRTTVTPKSSAEGSAEKPMLKKQKLQLDDSDPVVKATLVNKLNKERGYEEVKVEKIVIPPVEKVDNHEMETAQDIPKQPSIQELQGDIDLGTKSLSKHKEKRKHHSGHKKHKHEKHVEKGDSNSPSIESTVINSGGIKLKIKFGGANQGLSNSFSGSSNEVKVDSADSQLSNSTGGIALKKHLTEAGLPQVADNGKAHRHKHKSKSHKSESRKRTHSPSVSQDGALANDEASAAKRKPSANSWSSHQSEIPSSQSLLSLPMPPPEPKNATIKASSHKHSSKHISGKHKSKKHPKTSTRDYHGEGSPPPPPPPPPPKSSPPPPPPPPPQNSHTQLTTVTALPPMSSDPYLFTPYYPQNMMQGVGKPPLPPNKPHPKPPLPP